MKTSIMFKTTLGQLVTRNLMTIQIRKREFLTSIFDWTSPRWHNLCNLEVNLRDYFIIALTTKNLRYFHLHTWCPSRSLSRGKKVRKMERWWLSHERSRKKLAKMTKSYLMYSGFFRNDESSKESLDVVVLISNSFSSKRIRMMVNILFWQSI